MLEVIFLQKKNGTDTDILSLFVFCHDGVLFLFPSAF